MSHPGLMLGIEKNKGQNVGALHQKNSRIVGAHKIAIMASILQSAFFNFQWKQTVIA